jgi:hypothetical protein
MAGSESQPNTSVFTSPCCASLSAPLVNRINQPTGRLNIAVVDVVSVYDEFLEDLAQKATPEQILAFKASDQTQQRADELTERNKAGTLTPDESAELEQMFRFNRLVSMLKARAFKALSVA